MALQGWYCFQHSGAASTLAMGFVVAVFICAWLLQCRLEWDMCFVFFKVGLCAVYDAQKCLFDAQLKCAHLEVMVLIQFLPAAMSNSFARIWGNKRRQIVAGRCSLSCRRCCWKLAKMGSLRWWPFALSWHYKLDTQGADEFARMILLPT